MDLYQEPSYLSSYYQYAPMNSYQHQILSHFYQANYHFMTKTSTCIKTSDSLNNYAHLDQHFKVSLTEPNKEFSNAKYLTVLNSHKCIS